MSLRARVAVWTFAVALLTSMAVTAIFARDGEHARLDRLRAEGRRVAFSTVTLYDVLRLTGSDADKATLQAFLKSAVLGTSKDDALLYAVIVDNKGIVSPARAIRRTRDQTRSPSMPPSSPAMERGRPPTSTPDMFEWASTLHPHAARSFGP